MIGSSYLYISLAAFAAMFGGSLIGIFIARALPEHHLSAGSATAVKLSAGIVVSLTSLVLALMLSSANSSFSANTGIVKKLSSDLINLDHLLRIYGPDANGARTALRAYAPQSRFLSLLATADGRAIATRGRFSLSGRWAWRWKDRIDRAFVNRFAAPPALQPVAHQGETP